MIYNRKSTDIFFKYLFRVVSFFSVLALGAIIFFVFIQGVLPFALPTAQGIRLVPQRIEELVVNGEAYRDHDTFINLPKGTSSILISIPSIRIPSIDNSLENDSTGHTETLEIKINQKEKDPEKILSFIETGSGQITYPESYVYTVSWKGAIAALDRKLHILLPEPPYNPFKFLTGMDWRPSRFKVFGIFPMIAGTVLASLGAMLLGVPIAILCALFMAEFLGQKPAALVRAGVEVLAGIPSVVYGFFGLMVIVPAVKKNFNVVSGNTLLSGVVVLALMLLPTVITIAETSLRAVPLSVREASLSLGASKMQTAWQVVLPHAHSGVMAGIILGISRAVGETTAVILVAGNSPQLIKGPLESVRTLTATISMEMGYASGRHSEILFSIGVVLFIFILILNSMILAFKQRMKKQ